MLEIVKRMGALSSLATFFSLDVLDGQARTKDATRRLRWRTPEFFLYYAIFLVCVPLMFKAVVDISRPDHPNYPRYEHLLQDGFFGRKVDNSDGQYASFRDQIPTLAGVMAGHLALRWIYDRVVVAAAAAATTGAGRQVARVRFDLWFGLIFLLVIHGFGALKLLLIATFTFHVAHRARGSMVNPVLTWVTVVGLLFLNEKYQGYKFADILGPSVAWMDDWSGLLDRWHIHFNITALRLISYNLDYYWSVRAPPTTAAVKQEVRMLAETTGCALTV